MPHGQGGGGVIGYYIEMECDRCKAGRDVYEGPVEKGRSMESFAKEIEDVRAKKGWTKLQDHHWCPDHNPDKAAA